MLGMGLTLKVSDFKILLKNPKWTIVGVLIQFSVMPFLGWTISKILELPDFFAVGLILVSCCPGGTASNVIAYLSNLNVAFSVSMTFISTIAGVILTPLLITNISGDIIECGVFKGNSLIRFLTYREYLDQKYSKKIYGFDVFGKFPKAKKYER